MRTPKTKITKIPYFECNRCNINTVTNGRMCPCPRGGCEAIKKGMVITTVEVKLDIPKMNMVGGLTEGKTKTSIKEIKNVGEKPTPPPAPKPRKK